MIKKVDLNCDLGERSDIQLCELDAAIMPYINRCNICCGAHAGSIQITEETIKLAKKNNLLIGAHPGFEDPEHFGRRILNQPFEQTIESIKGQLEHFQMLLNKHQAKLTHIKLHGALYNLVESNSQLAEHYVSFVNQIVESPVLLGLAGGRLQQVILNHFPNVTFIAEAFIDRAYLNNGQLAPRDVKGAILHQLEAIEHQALQIASKNQVNTIEGKLIDLCAQSLCIHGDRHDAVDIAKVISRLLKRIDVLK